MRKEQLTDAITELDGDILDRYFIMKKNLREKKRKRQCLFRYGSLAACLTLIFAVTLIAVLQKPSTDDPISIRYDSLEEAHKALGYETLYAKLDLKNADLTDISISYAPVDTSEGVEADPNAPLVLKINASYSVTGQTLTTTPHFVYYCVAFNSDNTDETLAERAEKIETKVINGIPVQYYLIREYYDLEISECIRFAYGNNDYTIYTHVSGKQYGDFHIMFESYLENLLSDVLEENP